MKAKTKFTRLWSILLVLVMVVGMLPTVALAAGAATADFSADPTTALDLLNDAKTGTEDSTWNSSTKTLTLKGVNFETTATAVKLPDGSTIVLNGVNTIKGGNAASGACYGIFCEGNLTIQGTGTLNVTAGDAGGTGNNDRSCGIYTQKALTMSSGIVKAYAGTSAKDSLGIYSKGNFTISGTADVTATGGTAKGGGSFGINAEGEVIISGGEVKATGGTGRGSDGIYSGISKVTINSGTVMAIGGAVTAGWSVGIFAYNAEYGSGTVTINGGTVTSAADYHASETKPFYSRVAGTDIKTIDFNSNGGSGKRMVAKISGETYTLPENVFTPPADKEFMGWSVDGAKKAVGDNINVAANTTVKAVWEDITYTVNVTNGTASVSQAAAGTTVTLTANAASTGEVFDKWEVVSGDITLKDANSATTTFTMPAGDVSVKATYHTHSYGSVWKSDADKHWHECSCGDKSAEAVHTAGDWITDTPATAATAGTKHKECTACGYVMENGTIPATGYTVSFDANGGTSTMADVSGVLGDYTLPANGFTAPEGKRFKGWSVNGTEKAVGDKVTVSADTTVKAVWENITYTVSFDANDGSGTMANVTGVLGDYTLPKNGFTAPDGKQFKAWSVDGKEKAVGDKITVTADTTVKAVWENIPAAPTEYNILDGANSKWTQDSNGSLSIRGSGAFSEFVGVKVDGKSVDEKYYTVKEGSTIVTLKAGYLNTLTVGSHTLEIIWTDGSASTAFNVNAKSPQTGDNSMMALWIAVLFVSATGVLATAVFGKKKKYQAK